MEHGHRATSRGIGRSTRALVVLALGLGACGANPGERFFALEREYIQIVKPLSKDPAAATRALCAWLRENQARIPEINREYEAYRKDDERRKGTTGWAELLALQAANEPLFDDDYAALLRDETFFEASAWFQNTRPEPLPAACDQR